MGQGIKTDSGRDCCHNALGRVQTGSQITRPLAQVDCDNKPRQIGLNHDYNMIFSISPREC